MDELIDKLKEDIIKQLNLEYLKKEDIDADTPLFGTGLGLDSIDALELNVLLERNYGCKISSAHEGRKIFQSIRSIAEYIQANRNQVSENNTVSV
jgi:acyl carrier protein